MMVSAAPLHASNHYEGRSEYHAIRADKAPSIDGIGDDAAWQEAQWKALNHRWLGPAYTKDDFDGRYKVVWTKNKLFVLVELVDDVLRDTHRDPLVQYWDDDCLEVFVDEDHSGGDHQYNHNAFAYHVSLDNQSIDIGTDKKPRSYSHHVDSLWKQQANTITWELSIDIYADDYRDDKENNSPVELKAGKVMGFMLAYCDNDASEIRENFIGSEFAPGEEKDRGWIDAGLFGTLTLVE